MDAGVAQFVDWAFKAILGGAVALLIAGVLYLFRWVREIERRLDQSRYLTRDDLDEAVAEAFTPMITQVRAELEMSRAVNQAHAAVMLQFAERMELTAQMDPELLRALRRAVSQ